MTKAATTKKVCPSCEGEDVQQIKFQGEVYDQCRKCKFWTTKPGCFDTSE